MCKVTTTLTSSMSNKMDTLWMRTYGAIVLQWDSPILEALRHYYIQAAVDLYQSSSDTFPWSRYEDSGICMALIHLHGSGIKNPPISMIRCCIAVTHQQLAAQRW